MISKFDLIIERQDRHDKKLDCIFEKLNTGSGKIGKQGTHLKLLSVAVGFLYVLILVYRYLGGN